MRSYILLLIVFLNAISSFAQTGWQWTRFDESVGMFNQTEPLYMATDKLGAAVVTGYYYGDTLRMGNVKMPNPRYHTTYLQLFIIKHDIASNALWVKGSTGDGTEAIPNQIACDGNNNVIVFGHYDGTIFKIGDTVLHNTGTSTDMGFLMKLGPNGIVKWARNIDMGIAGFHSNTVGMGIDKTGAIYVTGHFNTDSIKIGSTTLYNGNAPKTETFLAKYSNAGEVIWAKSIGNNDFNLPAGLVVTPTGNSYMILGNTSADTTALDTLNLGSIVVPASPLMLVKFDKDGAALTAQGIDAKINSYPKAMAVDPHENVYVAGVGQYLSMGAYNNTGVLSKFSPQCDSAWTKWPGGTCYSVSADTCGHIWIAGSLTSFYGNYPFTMVVSGDTLRTTGATYDPAYLIHYDTAGVYHGGKLVNSGGDDESAVAVDNKGGVYFMGDVIQTSGIICNSYFNYPGTGEYLFLARYRYLTEMCKAPPTDTTLPTGMELVDAAGINIFPNPASREFTIRADNAFANGAKIIIYDMAGRMVATQSLSDNRATIPIGGLATGLYQLVIYNGSFVPQVKKLSIIN